MVTPILKYSGFIRSRGYCKCDQDIILNVQDGTCDLRHAETGGWYLR